MALFAASLFSGQDAAQTNIKGLFGCPVAAGIFTDLPDLFGSQEVLFLALGQWNHAIPERGATKWWLVRSLSRDVVLKVA